MYTYIYIYIYVYSIYIYTIDKYIHMCPVDLLARAAFFRAGARAIGVRGPRNFTVPQKG